MSDRAARKAEQRAKIEAEEAERALTKRLKAAIKAGPAADAAARALLAEHASRVAVLRDPAAAKRAARVEAPGAVPQSSASTVASETVDGSGAPPPGSKRGADAAAGENGAANGAPAAKAARNSLAGGTPLQREMSMGNGELIDGVAGKQGSQAASFRLNLQ